MIGLIDLQLQSWDKPQLCPPNLEIMKLATYYQKEENKFCRLINLDETELTGYEKIYVFSEADDYVTVPDTIKKAPNVIYGGTAFTNGVYIPFENKLIDYTLARTRIYASFLKDKYIAGLDEREINHSSQVYLSIGGSFHYKTDYFKNLKYKLNLLMVFWSCNIPVKLKYEEPKLGCYDPVPDFSRLLAAWSRGDIKNEKNIFERIPKTKKDCQEREQLNTILSQCPSLEKVFRQTYTSVQKGGLWKNGY